MPRRSLFAFLAATVSFIMAGCPLLESSNGDTLADDPLVGRAPAGTDGGATAGVTGGTATQATPVGGNAATQSFEARLQAEFPDCGFPAQLDAWTQEILDRVNIERAAAGLNSVRWNGTLAQQATQYACEMVHYDFFDHVNPVTKSTLGVRADQFEYDYQVIGENLAAGQRSPQQAMTDWMASPGHRQNILDPRFTELGVGVRTGGDYGFYWVQEFGLPATVRP